MVTGRDGGPDPLTEAVLRRYLPPPDPDPQADASISWTPGLPLFRVTVPSGLSPKDAERHEIHAWIRVYQHWGTILRDRWKVRGEEKHSLARLARRWVRTRGGERGHLSTDEIKGKIAFAALIDALRDVDLPARIRVGSGEGSAFVRNADGEIAEAPPSSYGVVGALKWLEQESLRRAKALLVELGAPEPEPEGEPLRENHGTELMEAVEATEATLERVADVYEATRGREAEKLDALLGHLREGCEYPEARKLAADDLGVRPGAIDVTVSRLRSRLEKPK